MKQVFFLIAILGLSIIMAFAQTFQPDTAKVAAFMWEKKTYVLNTYFSDLQQRSGSDSIFIPVWIDQGWKIKRGTLFSRSQRFPGYWVINEPLEKLQVVSPNTNKVAWPNPHNINHYASFRIGDEIFIQKKYFVLNQPYGIVLRDGNSPYGNLKFVDAAPFMGGLIHQEFMKIDVSSLDVQEKKYLDYVQIMTFEGEWGNPGMAFIYDPEKENIQNKYYPISEFGVAGDPSQIGHNYWFTPFQLGSFPDVFSTTTEYYEWMNFDQDIDWITRTAKKQGIYIDGDNIWLEPIKMENWNCIIPDPNKIYNYACIRIGDWIHVRNDVFRGPGPHGLVLKGWNQPLPDLKFVPSNFDGWSMVYVKGISKLDTVTVMSWRTMEWGNPAVNGVNWLPDGTKHPVHPYARLGVYVNEKIGAYFLTPINVTGKKFNDIQTPTAVTRETTNSIPTKFALNQNYPNPFNPSTTISFALPQTSEVDLTVYNSLGQKIQTLISGQQLPAGLNQVTWNATNIPSGIYFYRISANGQVAMKQMMLVK